MAKIEIIEQAKQFYSKLNKMQKIIIFGAMGIVIIGIIAIMISTGEKKEFAVLFSDLDPKDAGKIVESLKAKNINYELTEQGRTVLIEKGVVYDTRLDLAKDGLPEQGGVGYEIFDKTNLGMSEFVQKLNARRALEGELARTINSYDAVKNVRVHLVVPETALFEKDQKQPTASVSLHFKPGKTAADVSIAGIQNLVAKSVEGMNPGSVTVVDHRGKVLSAEALDEKSIAGMTSKQYEQQRNVEEYLSGKVQSLLD